MKVLTNFEIAKSAFRDPKDFDSLLEIFPGGSPGGSNYFSGQLEKNSAVLAQIFDKLSVLGFKPWKDRNRAPLPNEYWFFDEVKYTRKDYTNARYLNWFANHSLEEVAQNDGEGRITINTDPFDMAEVESRTKKALFDGTLHLVKETLETLVSDTFRKIIEQAGLIGIQFEDRARFTGEQATKVPEKFWVLRSNLVLPPISKQTMWVDDFGEACDSDTPVKYIPTGEHRRYDGSALAPMEPFDLALIRECKPPGHATIMSQRFYQLCLKHKVPLCMELIEVVPG